MEAINKESNYLKEFFLFTSGFVLGTVGSYYCFFKHQTVIKKNVSKLKLLIITAFPL